MGQWKLKHPMADASTVYPRVGLLPDSFEPEDIDDISQVGYVA